MQKKPVIIKRNVSDIQDDKIDQVKLKPILGIRAGVYLSVLYLLILFTVFFLLLVLPGLQNPGAVLHIKTEPEGAAIRIDGIYMGVSVTFFHAPKGIHIIEAVLPGFETESVSLEIPGHIFGSLIFPVRKKIEFQLKTNDPTTAFTKAAEDFAAWSFGGEPTASWQVPLVLSESAYRIGPYTVPETDKVLESAVNFTVTRSALRDLTRSKILLDNAGLSPSPSALTGSISDILVFLSENPASASWLSNLLPSEYASFIKTSGWYKNGYAYEKRIILVDDELSQNRLNLSGISFKYIPSGKIITDEGGRLEQQLDIAVKKFMISENPVPRSVFEVFLNENPQWMDSFTDYFEEEISVFPFEAYDREIITGISWYAANAFCLWLTRQLPASMTGMEVRLPAEIEWEYAAGSGIVGMDRTGWEWCADQFTPLQITSFQLIDSPERVLRGKPSAQEAQTRASLPPELSSPFVTFRIVITEKDR
jgi:hypothetical protein